MKTNIMLQCALLTLSPQGLEEQGYSKGYVTYCTYKKVQTDSEGVHKEVKRHLFLNNYFSYSKGRGALTTSFRKEGNIALVLFGISKHKH